MSPHVDRGGTMLPHVACCSLLPHSKSDAVHLMKRRNLQTMQLVVSMVQLVRCPLQVAMAQRTSCSAAMYHGDKDYDASAISTAELATSSLLAA